MNSGSQGGGLRHSSRMSKSIKSKGSKKSRKMKMSPVRKKGLKINRPGANKNASTTRRNNSKKCVNSRISSNAGSFK